jgi:hypothetical protein
MQSRVCSSYRERPVPLGYSRQVRLVSSGRDLVDGEHRVGSAPLGERLSEQRRLGVADQDRRPAQAEPADQHDQVVDQRWQAAVVAGRGLAVTGQVGGDGDDVATEVGGGRPPHRAVVAEAVQEHDGTAVAAPAVVDEQVLRCSVRMGRTARWLRRHGESSS